MEFATLKLLIKEHQEAHAESTRYINELLEMAQIDWDKVRSRKGVLARNKTLRAKLKDLASKQDQSNAEIAAQIAEIITYTMNRDRELKLRNAVNRDRYSEDIHVPDPHAITPDELP